MNKNVTLENYVELAGRTVAPVNDGVKKRLGEYFSLNTVLPRLMMSISNKAERIDEIKRAVFYGPSNLKYDSLDGPYCVRSDNAVNAVHAAIGMVTEVGEISEAMEKCKYDFTKLDKVNIMEEMGDLMWYVALMCDTIGVDLQVVIQKNIDKLRTRFPDKFTEDKALNRDTFSEREVLDDRN